MAALIEELRDYTDQDLFRDLQKSDEDFERWLIDLGLLNRRKICDCGEEMKEVIDSTGVKVCYSLLEC